MHFPISQPARHFIAVFLLSAVALLVCGCGSRSVRPPVPFKSIALIPVASPQSIYTENRLVPLPLVPVLIASSISNRGKSAEFSRRMDTPRSEMGAHFTKMLLDELRTRGFTVHVYEDFDRSQTDPDDIDYAKLQTDEAVLHVYFRDVSMDSPRTSTDYLPRVNVDATFIPRVGRPDDSLSLYYRYGADAGSNDKDWSIPSNAKYRYPNFDALISRADEVAESWQAAMHEMAHRMAQDLPSPD